MGRVPCSRFGAASVPVRLWARFRTFLAPRPAAAASSIAPPCQSPRVSRSDPRRERDQRRVTRRSARPSGVPALVWEDAEAAVAEAEARGGRGQKPQPRGGRGWGGRVAGATKPHACAVREGQALKRAPPPPGPIPCLLLQRHLHCPCPSGNPPPPSHTRGRVGACPPSPRTDCPQSTGHWGAPTCGPPTTFPIENDPPRKRSFPLYPPVVVCRRRRRGFRRLDPPPPGDALEWGGIGTRHWKGGEVPPHPPSRPPAYAQPLSP